MKKAIKRTAAAAVLISTLLTSAESEAKDYTKNVNVFMGSNSSAQCNPAAIRPFGMISPGPFNWDCPSGYQSRGEELRGFNHTHLQGTGCGSYGVVLVLPTVGNKEMGTRVKCPRQNQSAEPGYYSAKIQDMDIKAEMTATKRSAIHRYTFPQSNTARILIDTSQGVRYNSDSEMYGRVQQVSKTELSGDVTTTAWGTHTTYFHIEFSKPVKFTEKAKQGGYVSFATKANEQVFLKLGISYVSAENAKLNLTTEIEHWDFDKIRNEAKKEWNSQLSKIDIEGGTADQQAIFYSSLYHLMFHPQLTSDVNNQYRGLDGSIHTADTYNHYSVLSTWDTFRAAHPLYTLLNPDVQLDIIKTMIDDYKDSGWGPRWKLGTKEVFCMPGSWADVIIPDAYLKVLLNSTLKQHGILFTKMLPLTKINTDVVDATIWLTTSSTDMLNTRPISMLQKLLNTHTVISMLLSLPKHLAKKIRYQFSQNALLTTRTCGILKQASSAEKTKTATGVIRTTSILQCLLEKEIMTTVKVMRGIGHGM